MACKSEQPLPCTTQSFARAAFVLLVAATMLAACGTRAAQEGALPAARRPEGISSSPEPLLYVSDWATNDVYMYEYSSRGAVGKLTGFAHPSGQCIDRAHNVWIANLQGQELVEYAHGGTDPIGRLKTDGYPIGCSVNFTTGTIVAANFYTPSGPGDLQVWRNGNGTPQRYTSSSLYYFWPPAFDKDGNVFVEGEPESGTRYGVAELPHGGTALRELTLKGATIHFAGAALWDGTHLDLTDQSSDGNNTTVIFRTAVTGKIVRVIGRTHLYDSCHHNASDVEQPFVVRKNGNPDTVIGGNLSCRNRVNYWKYPDGGGPSASLDDAPREPFGVSVSP